jgi:uncharacterized membrane protein
MGVEVRGIRFLRYTPVAPWGKDMTHRIPGPLEPRIPLTFALGAASLGCVLMVVLRMLATGSLRYAGLLWNLFLAWIPYLLSLAIQRVAAGEGDSARVRPLALLLGLAWLFFYPNAPYILTDFIHVIWGRRMLEAQPPLITATALLWYDILLNSSFAFVGHFIGLISLLMLHRMIGARVGWRWGWAFVVAAVGMGGYGIYIGRFERLNSWDIVRAPLETLRTGLLNLFNLKAILFSLSFALFIFLTYLVVLALFQSAQGARQAP